MAAGRIEKISKVARWGSSLGLRIPKEVVDRLRLENGDSVNVRVSADTIVITRAKPRRKWTEAELLRGVIPAICGPEMIAERVGKEIM